MTDDPDVLLLSVDSLRADHLPSNGYDRETAPFFTSLTERGTYFENAFATAGFTLGSVTSFLTSTYPLEYGGYGPLSPERPLISEMYRESGRRTVGIHENGWLTPEYQFDRGFDRYVDIYHSSAPQDRFRRWLSDRLPHDSWIYNVLRRLDDVAGRITSQTQGDDTDHSGPVDSDRRVVERAKAALGTNGSTFVWAHLMGPHSPYDPPEAYRGTFGKDVDSETIEYLWEAIRQHPETLTDEQIQTVVNLYDDEICRFDDNLKRLFKVIDIEETIVAIIGDHGELFGEHENRFQHGPWMYDELLHVPMLFLGPEVPKTRVETPVSLIDLVPTLLSASDDQDFAPATLRGRDLLTNRSPEPVLACSAHEGTQVTDLDWSRRRLMVRTDRWKLVRRGTGSGVDECWYDVASGAEVATNETGPEQLRDKIAEFESKLSIGSNARAQQPSDELTDRLKDLGYLR